ncbi:TetR/AcrR family transcriptional regulator [Erythrobacter sp. GH1-10]|uniref:TetR/AcrR family transcriptional regulator n=1 Tax=Erythrobacter sp. GH1-10 TaxID=3349334 RepID=UPI00387836EB
MDGVRTARWIEKRETILDAGARVLNRAGLSGLRLAEVAAEIGLRRPSIAYYFGNVEELAEALYERALEQIDTRIEVASREGSTRERIARFLDLELEHYALERRGEAVRRPQLGEIRALSLDRRRRLGAKYDGILRRLSAMLETADAEGGLILQLGPAHFLMESVFWIPAWIDEYEEWMFERVRDAMIETYLHGIRIRPSTDARPSLVKLAATTGPGVDRDAYLRAASRLLCDHGVRGMAIDMIAAELNVTKGSFYHHHTEKQELIEACFAQSEARLSEWQRQASRRDLPPEDRVSAVLHSVVSNQLAGKFPLLRTSALPSVGAEDRAKIIAQARRSFRWFASEISAAVKSGGSASPDPFVAAQMIGAAANASYDLGRMYRGKISARDAPVFTLILECGATAL